MTNSDLQNLCSRWQALLRLQDWDVEVKFVHGEEIDWNAGQCRHNVSLHRAWVKILDPQIDPNEEDVETTLVHELLHLHAAPFHNPETGLLEGSKLQALEVMIEQLSKALVTLDREKDLARLEGAREEVDKVIEVLRGA